MMRKCILSALLATASLPALATDGALPPPPLVGPKKFVSGFTLCLGVGASSGFSRVRGKSDYSFDNLYKGVTAVGAFPLDTAAYTTYQQYAVLQYQPSRDAPTQYYNYEYYQISDVNFRSGFAGFAGILAANFTCKLRNSPLCAGIGIEGGLMTNTAKFSYRIASITGNAQMGPVEDPAPYDNIGQLWMNFGKEVQAKLMNRGYIGASVNAGIAIERTHFYVKAGWSAHHWALKLNCPYIKDKNKWANCLMVGGGIDLTLTDHALIALESMFHIGHKTKIKLASAEDSGDGVNFARYTKDINCGVDFTPFVAVTTVQFKIKMPSCATN